MAGLGTIRVGKNRRVYCVPIWPVKPAPASNPPSARPVAAGRGSANRGDAPRSEEHTSELQSLMRISYAVFCLKKTIKKKNTKSESIRKQKNKRNRVSKN